MNIIEGHGLSFEYTDDEGNTEVTFDGLDISIEEGSFVAVAGHNGSGKTTLVKLFNGLLKPTSGTLTVNGIDALDPANELELRKTVGLVFQNPDNQLVAMTVEEDVAFGPENLGCSPEESESRVNFALESVGMTAFRNFAPHKLSGGQKQRIAIAGMLAMKPKCLILDEPTSMLDPRGRGEVVDTIIRLNREQGMTVILITHFMEEAALADRMIVLDNGKIAADGTPHEVFADINSVFAAGIEPTYAAMLANELKNRGIALPDGIITDDECAQALSRLLKGCGAL